MKVKGKMTETPTRYKSKKKLWIKKFFLKLSEECTFCCFKLKLNVMYISLFIIPLHEATLSINQLSGPIMYVKEASTVQERISSGAVNRKCVEEF